MNQQDKFHIVSVGWNHFMLENLCERVAARSEQRFSHIVHPIHTAEDWSADSFQSAIFFFQQSLREPMPQADRDLLISLEREGVPTIHNMIMGDRIVSKLKYHDALGYATYLAHRLIELFEEIRPSVILGTYDGLHSGIALAVARKMNIPWVALHFTHIPGGLTGFCERMLPSARVRLTTRSQSELNLLAEESLQQFESKEIQAPAYIAPPPLPLFEKLSLLPNRIVSLIRTLKRSRLRAYLQYTHEKSGYDVAAVLNLFRKKSQALKALAKLSMISKAPDTPYVFFGLHMQPESSTDVWAPFFCNQMRVIELLSRSVPPTHKLLVKIHKSDMANYSREQLERMKSFPGVDLVAPFADSHDFIRNSDLVVSIQGTIGLEGALFGKPVIMLGDSPNTVFPSVSRIGEIDELPALLRSKLSESSPSRSEIVKAYAAYLAPFLPASDNVWTVRKSDEEIEGYVRLFAELQRYIAARKVASPQST